MKLDQEKETIKGKMESIIGERIHQTADKGSGFAAIFPHPPQAKKRKELSQLARGEKEEGKIKEGSKKP